MLVLRGELDLTTAPRLEARLAGGTDTILDLTDLTFIDSSGIQTLVRAAQRARELRCRFEVHNPRSAVRQVIELVRVGELLGLSESVASPTDS